MSDQDPGVVIHFQGALCSLYGLDPESAEGALFAENARKVLLHLFELQRRGDGFGSLEVELKAGKVVFVTPAPRHRY